LVPCIRPEQACVVQPRGVWMPAQAPKPGLSNAMRTLWPGSARTPELGVLGKSGLNKPTMTHVSESPHYLSVTYRWPFGPPGLALARARDGPFLAGPCLARPNIAAGRVVLAHGLCRRPRHGPASLFRAGPARGARPTCRARASCGPRWGAPVLSRGSGDGDGEARVEQEGREEVRRRWRRGEVGRRRE